MADRNRSNLNRDEWLRSVRDLAMHCPLAEPGAASARVRELNELIVAAPNAALLHGLRPLDGAKLEMLLQAGGADAAVLGLFGEGSGYMLSRSDDEQTIATVNLPGTAMEKSALGSTAALAMVGALARALANTAAAARITMRMAPHIAAAARPQLVASALH